MTHPTKHLPTVFTLAALTCSGLFGSSAVAAPEPGDGALSPWPVATETHSAAEFLATALPVATNKSDSGNTAPGFFRVPEATAHEPGTILYVGLRPESAPVISSYHAPLFSGSVESFDLGISGAQPGPQTVGDIGEIFSENTPPTPMAYIVYRLDFSTHGGDPVALFAPPKVTTEPFTTSSPSELDANFAWEAINFSDFEFIRDQEKDWDNERNPHAGNRVARTAATPEPTSIGLLALGAVGLGFWRRQRSR